MTTCAVKRKRPPRSEAGAVLLIGMIEGGRMAWPDNTLAYRAREGTRYAVDRGGDSAAPASTMTISTYVKGRAAGLDPTKMTVTTTWTGAASPSNTPGNFVTIVVNYQ